MHDRNSNRSTPDSGQFNSCGASGDCEIPVPVQQNSDASNFSSDDERSSETIRFLTTANTHQFDINRRQTTTRHFWRRRNSRRRFDSSASSTASSNSNFERSLFSHRYRHHAAVFFQNEKKKRMVLDPKYSNRNDYGSIHSTEQNIPALNSSQHNSTHALLSARCSNVSATEATADEEDAPATSKMTQGDLYQRQPLLPTPTKSEKWNHGTHPVAKEYFDEEDEEDNEIIRNGIIGSKSNGMIKISMPPPVREEPKFPKEKWKTFIALFIMIINFIFTTASLAMVHERVPDRDKYGPLPDKFLDTVPAFDWALDVSEYLIMISVNATALVLVFHKHRFIVFRRVFLILGLLYMMRAITMYITVLPIASKTYYCSPKANQTSAYIITTRVLQLISGFGLSVNGKHTYCGDYIYSGHTVVLVLSYLLISEYSPKKFFPLHWISWIAALTGIVMVLLAHGHYTVDVVIAYYVTTRLFWTYHTLANNTQLKKSGPNNYIGREWWYPCFQYFERNVGGPVPREYNWPLPWPRRCHSKSRDS